MTSLLAIDASKAVGVAFFASPTAKPQCQTWHGRGSWDSDEMGSFFSEFESWLIDLLRVMRPQILAFESPLLLPRQKGRGTDEQQVRRLIGMATIAEKVAYQTVIRCWEVNVQDVKSHAGVPGRRPEGMTKGQYKDLMTIAMTALGYECADSHQSDAACVARVVYDQLGELNAD
jgi:hypothetical protein